MGSNLNFQLLLDVAIICVPVVLFGWNRYLALERRLDDRDARHNKLEHRLDIIDVKNNSEHDRLELFSNGNKELIEHRTSRFNAELENVKNALSEKIRHMQDYLDSNSDYVERK